MITRTNTFSGTEEQYLVNYPDTNTNDLVTMEISVNDQVFQVRQKVINTQEEFYQFQTELMELIEQLKLTRLSRFRA